MVGDVRVRIYGNLSLTWGCQFGMVVAPVLICADF